MAFHLVGHVHHERRRQRDVECAHALRAHHRLRKAVRRRSCGTEREWDGVGVGWSESGSGMPERNPRMRFCVLARGERPPARSG